MDGFCQLIINMISSVLDGYGASASAPGHHGNGFTRVAAKREEKGFQTGILGVNTLNQVFPAFLYLHQIHSITRLIDSFS